MDERTGLRTALGLDVLVGVVWLAAVGLLIANGPVFDADALFLIGLFGATAAAYCVTGTAIARRQPANAITWLCFVVAFFLVVGLTATEYAIYTLEVAPGSLPAAEAVLALAEPTPLIAISGIVLILYVFPTGRPLGGFWRIAMWTVAVATILGVVTSVLTPHRILNVWADRLELTGLVVRTPFGLEAARGLAGPFADAAGVLVAVGSALAIASLFVRRRRGDATTRAQLRWLAYVAGAAGAWIAFWIPIALVVGEGPEGDSRVFEVFWFVITPLVALGIPIAIGVAIVKHGLYDIDVVVNRTLVFGGLAAFITLVYVAVVVGVGQLVGATGTSPVLSVIATAVIAVAFQPVRQRVQRIANRLVYGQRATPYEVLSDFSDRIGGAFAIDELFPRMAEILAQGTGAATATVWISDDGVLRAHTVWPPDAPRPAEVSSIESIAADEGDLSSPVRHRGELLGALSVRKQPGDPPTPTERKLVDDLAAQAGLVLRNVGLIEELRESRRRIVSAQDERAKRLERNLHDGAQQQLVALSVKLGLAESLARKDSEKAANLLEELKVEATDALENLRDLARGIYPPLLADRGLREALESQARRATVPVEIVADAIGRFEQDVESAVYFCCLEALQNVAKYAEASRVTIGLEATDRGLAFTVVDNGRGFDVADRRLGSGLRGMADRLEAVGGTLRVRSFIGEGTTIEGWVPASRV